MIESLNWRVDPEEYLGQHDLVFEKESQTWESGLAIGNGDLDPARLESYRKLQNELIYLASREEGGTRLYEKLKYKKIAKWSKELKNRP